MANQRCTAKSKSTGDRCKRQAIAGGTVCRTHGGKAPQVAEAARRRLMAAEAGEQLARLGVTIETTPVEVLEAMLYEAAGNVTVLRHLAADLGLDVYGDLYHENGSPSGRALPHVLVVMYNDERDRLAKLAEACFKLGLDERRVRLAEAQVERFLTAVTAAVTDAGLGADQAARFKQALAERLRGAS